MATSTLFGSDAARLAGIAARRAPRASTRWPPPWAAPAPPPTSPPRRPRASAGPSRPSSPDRDLPDRPLRAARPDIEKLIRYAAEHFPAFGDAIISGVEKGIGYLGTLKDKGVEAFKAVREYLEPLTSELDDLWDSITRTNGPADILFGLLKDGGGIILGVLDAARPLVTIAGGLLDAFSKLPGPVQAVVIALGALKIATSTDLLGRLSGRNGLSGAVGKAGSSMVGFAQTARVNMRLAGDEVGALSRTAGGLSSAFATYFPRTTATVRNSVAGMTSAFGQARSAHREMVAQLNGTTSGSLAKAVGDLAGLQAAAKNVATQGFNAIRSVGRGVVNFLGGPWGAAMAGAAIAVSLVQSAIQEATDTEQKWATALREGGASAAQAARDMDTTAANVERLNGGFTGFLGKITIFGGAIGGITPDVKDAEQANRDYWKSLDPISQAQSKVSEWTNTLSYRIETLGTDSEDTRTAQERLAYWTQVLGERQTHLDNQTQSATEAIQEQAQAALAATNADVAASMAEDVAG